MFSLHIYSFVLSLLILKSDFQFLVEAMKMYSNLLQGWSVYVTGNIAYSEK